MLLLMVILFHFASLFASNVNYCDMRPLHDSVGHPGITITCQSGD